MSEKYYQLGTYTEEQWDELHAELIADGNVYEAVPVRAVSIEDDKLHSPTRGTYLLTDEEASNLKNDPRVKFINIDYTKYPEQFKPPPKEIQAASPELIQRYSSAVKNYREFEDSNLLAASPDATDSNRAGYQFRCQAADDPWYNFPESTVLTENIFQYGTGRDVDVVVADDGTWFGHPEFQNNTVLSSDSLTPTESPNGYTGGNLLPGNGTCDLLDLVLDGPYYIDPDYFNADPDNRLETRWDGTIVPIETVARSWWSNSSNRSSKFSGEGTITIDSTYTRQNNNGSNTTQPFTGFPYSVGQHGTPCAALTYGRTQGWAYNANKWAFNLYNIYGTDIEPGFDLVKMFHKLKPKNSNYGTKDPTIMSNSWGYRADKDPSGSTYYYTHRSSTNNSYTSETGIQWLSHMGTQGDNGRWKSEMKTNSLTTAQDELIDAGVIFVVAAGNSNQKQVKSDHPDYNNYITTTDGGSLEDSSLFEFGVEVYGTTNRRGFPQQGGRYVAANGSIKYKTINVGALDDNLRAVLNIEQKVNYSDRGNDIDVYAPADGTLAANKDYASEGDRPDTYAGLSVGATDCSFGGTSAACPVTCGFIATILEHNRDWTWKEVLDWIDTLEDRTAGSEFYYGTETTVPVDANWEDYEGLEGGTATVLYQNLAIQKRFYPGKRPLSKKLQYNGGLTLKLKK